LLQQRYFFSRQIIELSCLHHVLDLLAHIDVFLIARFLTDRRQHVIKNIADHFDLSSLLQLKVLLAKPLRGILAVLFVLLRSCKHLCELAHLIVHALLLCCQVRELSCHVFVHLGELLAYGWVANELLSCMGG
jgi:hypothetical protein